MELIASNNFKILPDGSIEFRDGLSKEEWYEDHRKFIHAKKFANAWIKKSREYGIERFGVDYVADSEVAIEVDLFGDKIEEKVSVEADDKSKGIFTLHGMSQSFVIWQRKMGPEIEHWNREQLTKALPLLEPIEAQARRIRERLVEF